MNVHEIRAAAVSRLRGRGIEVSDRALLKTLANMIEANGGPSRNYSVSPGDYIQSFLAPKKATPKAVTFRQIKPRTHLRQAEINEQPRQVSMGWDGSGTWWRDR